MKSKLTLAVRLLLGFIFFASGIAGLFNLAPPPAEMPEKMMAFFNGMMATTYFFPLLKITEIVCGALLLLGMYVPLALVILAPIVLNIFGVHVFVDTSGLPVAVVVGLLTAYLAFFASPYKDTIRVLFRRR